MCLPKRAGVQRKSASHSGSYRPELADCESGVMILLGWSEVSQWLLVRGLRTRDTLETKYLSPRRAGLLMLNLQLVDHLLHIWN